MLLAIFLEFPLRVNIISVVSARSWLPISCHKRPENSSNLAILVAYKRPNVYLFIDVSFISMFVLVSNISSKEGSAARFFFGIAASRAH